MARIFISYRRAASSGQAGRLYDRLSKAFGPHNVFMDTEDIPAGETFESYILTEIERCDIFLLMLARGTLDRIKPNGDNTGDWLFREIRHALGLRHVRIIPILVDGFSMPKPEELPHEIRAITGLNAEVLVHQAFAETSGRIIKRIRGASHAPSGCNLARVIWDLGGNVNLVGWATILSLIVAASGITLVSLLNSSDDNNGNVQKDPVGQLPTPTEIETPADTTPPLQSASSPAFTLVPQEPGTWTPTPRPTETPLPTASYTPTSTQTPTDRPTQTSSPTFTATATYTPTMTPSGTPTSTLTPTATLVPSTIRTPSAADAISPENVSEVDLSQTLHNNATVKDLVFSPDGSSLITVDLTSTIKIWDVSSGNLLRSWQQTGVWTIAVSPNGALIAGGGTDTRIYLWDTLSGELRLTLQGHTAAVSSVAFNPTCPDALTACEVGLVSGGFDNRVRLWNLQTGDAEVLTGHVNPVTVVAFNPNGRTVTSGSYNGSLIEWNIRTGRQVSTLAGHSGTVTTIGYSASCIELQGSCTFLMASSGDDRRVLLWDASSGQLIDDMRHTHTATINCLDFSPDGRLLATASSDFTIRLLDIVGNRELKVLNAHPDFVNTIMFSPSGQVIASGSNDGTIKLWEPRD